MGGLSRDSITEASLQDDGCGKHRSFPDPKSHLLLVGKGWQYAARRGRMW